MGLFWLVNSLGEKYACHLTDGWSGIFLTYMPKKITIEQLARATQEEFHVVHKRMDEGFKRMDEGFKAIANVLDLMRADISDIKIALRP